MRGLPVHRNTTLDQQSSSGQRCINAAGSNQKLSANRASAQCSVQSQGQIWAWKAPSFSDDDIDSII